MAAENFNVVYSLDSLLAGAKPRSAISIADVEAFASKLAKHAEFVRAKNKHTRMLAAERFLGEDADRWRLRIESLVNRAQAICSLEAISASEATKRNVDPSK